MLREPLQLENRMVHVGASLGMAIFPDDAPDMESLCIAADLRMYDNKRQNAVSEEHPPKATPPANGQAKPKGEGRISLQL